VSGAGVARNGTGANDRAGAESVPVAMLVCVECGCKSGDAERGWQGHLVERDDDGKSDEQEVVFFCPDCAAREFGETPPGWRR
jgi:hypothetical protein